ncbi:hypothetical protein THTE_0786 [Thermogutta terrifontis]|jgi:hypothetical protein|uniref:DUF6677 domain-containing protein n=1 Tax=Thermogutta terrifontis TaxID=1331910 RepID=A0A286RBR1_9BACT|nr:DUF6677 family protein [Thermogutta terrifontis]ASV73388.1 hypothetical protein THTE_0786 [Thermogutta terrifontis]
MGERARTLTQAPAVQRSPGFLDEEGRWVTLKDPWIAAFLAWLLPGLGHWYQGRQAKAILFFVCIMGLFIYGCYLGGNRELGYARVVYASFRPGDMRLYYLCQIGVGLPAMPALIQAARVRQNKPPLWNNFMAPPRLGTDDGNPPTLSRICYELHAYFDLGSLYTAIAGLLNILVIFDAFGGPLFPEPSARKDQEAAQDSPSAAAPANAGEMANSK